MNPAQHMRMVLAELRQRGLDFESAWRQGIRTLPKGTCPESKKYIAGWKAVLRWAKPAFRDAYESLRVVHQHDERDDHQQESERDLYQAVA